LPNGIGGVVERLSGGRTTVVDATNVRPEARARLVAIARRFDVAVVVLRFPQPEHVLIAQNTERDKRLAVPEVLDYAALMAAYATREFLGPRTYRRSTMYPDGIST
jgi:predicted kinase